jgi:hypothetical protein
MHRRVVPPPPRGRTNGRIRAAAFPILAFAAWAAAGASAAEPPRTEGEELPPGVVQVVPRGTLEAIVEPELVPAPKASLPEDAWVLGVEIDGEAHAYSLNLLNHHEVVNDRIGEVPFAAVW